jgi:hypothetical protein
LSTTASLAGYAINQSAENEEVAALIKTQGVH